MELSMIFKFHFLKCKDPSLHLSIAGVRMSEAHHDQGEQAFQLSRFLTPSRPVSQAWAVGRALEDGSAP